MRSCDSPDQLLFELVEEYGQYARVPEVSKKAESPVKSKRKRFPQDYPTKMWKHTTNKMLDA